MSFPIYTFLVFSFVLFCFSFPPREVPLVLVVKFVWLCWILLAFSCLWSQWFLHQIWMRVLLVILSWRFFPIITLNISCHSLLTFRVSAEKSVNNLKGGSPICYLLAFNIFSFYLTLVSLINMCWCVSPWVYPVWYSLCFLYLNECFLSPIRGVFSYNLLKYYLFFFLKPPWRFYCPSLCYTKI